MSEPGKGSDVDVTRSEFQTVVQELAEIKRLQTVNLPRFNAALKRMARLEKNVSANTVSIAELRSIAVADKEARAITRTQIVENSTKLDEIYSLITTSKTALGFVKKHGPRLAAFVLGYLVLSGKMSHETQELFGKLFGI